VKIFKMLPSGKDLILEVFGTGDPLGAVAAYDGRPFSEVGALEATARRAASRAYGARDPRMSAYRWIVSRAVRSGCSPPLCGM
jgi:hypothetical protein